MFQILKDISYEKSDIKKFGIIFSIIMLIVSIFLLYKSSNLYFFTGLFFIFLSFGILFPVLIKPIYALWMILGSILGSLMTIVILTFIFYLIMFPISIIARILKKNFLELKLNKNANSYWNDRNTNIKNINSYEDQY
tara:strand:+ start:272 stop:682 length:411 start_codon:yes stop_codon:yes gene_type:complete